MSDLRSTQMKLFEERQLALRLRDAIDFCKGDTGITDTIDMELDHERRVSFEQCLTKNYLVKHGWDYFGKRDIIYLDLLGTSDVNGLLSRSYE